MPCRLKAYEKITEARQSLARYFDYYNTRRPCSSLDARTPDTLYFSHQPRLRAAWALNPGYQLARTLMVI